MLADNLERAGYTVRRVREPGGTPVGETIRSIVKWGDVKSPLTELLLFQAARAELVASVIMPAIQAGEIVVCDRFTGSTFAYQGYGRGLGAERVRSTSEVATQGVQPAVTFLLTTETGTANERRITRNQTDDRFESEGSAFMERVKAGYETTAVEEGWERIDASGDATQVARTIWREVKELLNRLE